MKNIIDPYKKIKKDMFLSFKGAILLIRRVTIYITHTQDFKLYYSYAGLQIILLILRVANVKIYFVLFFKI